MIKYYKLFDLLNRKEIKRTELLKIISSPTLAKLGKGDIVKTDILDKICLFLECQPGDIMECIYDYTEPFKDGAIITAKKVLDKIDETESIDIISYEPKGNHN